ncbi:MAG: hypothetical protein AB7O47_06805 [Flavobacteriales bacterium]
MIKINTFLPFLFVLGLVTVGYGQKKSSSQHIPSIGGHVGVLSYLGDVKGSQGSTVYTYWRPGFGFYLEKKIGGIFGVSVNGLFGKISKSQLDEAVFQNFETSVMNFDLNVLFDFDNGKIINRSSLFSPYFSAGFGYLSFDPKGDLKNKYGNYFHWTDGTLRDIDQNTPGSDTLSTIVIRDYTYESSLKDSTNNYSKTTFTIPLRFGLKFKLAPNLDARIGVAYILTFTDYLDNVKGGGNDNMIYTSFGLQYNFAASESDDKYKDFDFSKLDKIDTDEDGVKDDDDMCQNTPKGVKVDGRGCPLDGDKDGVPDYLDKELNTLAGKIVNSDGVTLTDEMIEARESMKDSVQTERRVFKADDLSTAELDAIQKEYEQANKTAITPVTIPEKYKILDLDKDNYISAKEVTNAIDQFFDGENNLTAKDLHQLIDFYFEQ